MFTILRYNFCKLYSGNHIKIWPKFEWFVFSTLEDIFFPNFITFFFGNRLKKKKKQDNQNKIHCAYQRNMIFILYITYISICCIFISACGKKWFDFEMRIETRRVILLCAEFIRGNATKNKSFFWEKIALWFFFCYFKKSRKIIRDFERSYRNIKRQKLIDLYFKWINARWKMFANTQKKIKYVHTFRNFWDMRLEIWPNNLFQMEESLNCFGTMKIFVKILKIWKILKFFKILERLSSIILTLPKIFKSLEVLLFIQFLK